MRGTLATIINFSGYFTLFVFSREFCCGDSDLVNLLPMLKKMSPNISVNSSTTVRV